MKQKIKAQEEGTVQILGIEALLNEMSLLERYRVINIYKYNSFSILNTSSTHMVEKNKLLAVTTLEVLKDIKKVILADLDNLTIDDINIIEIINNGNRETELSQLIGSEIMIYDINKIKKEYDGYLKAEKLNSVYPEEDRRNNIAELTEQISKLEKTIEALESIDNMLGQSQKQKMNQLTKEKIALEESLNYITETDIKERIYVHTYTYLNNVLTTIVEGIDYLERNIVL